MIILVNVTEDLQPIGVHTYEMRINNEVITTFTHRREEGLSRCLQRAALAAEKAQMLIAKEFEL